MAYYMHQLAWLILFVGSVQTIPAALKPYIEKDQKEKTYLTDETRLTTSRTGWRDYEPLHIYRDDKPIKATFEEELVRKVFVDTPNKKIVAGFRKNRIDKQKGVLAIIECFADGRKFKGWNAKGYYARAAIDRKLVALCRRVSFNLFEQAAWHVPPTFFYLYNWVRRNSPLPTLAQIEKASRTVLENASIRVIVQVLNEHPEEKNNAIYTMLSNVFPITRRDKFVKMYDKKMCAICERTGFDDWKHIDPNSLLLGGEAMRRKTIRTLASTGLRAIALEAYSDLLQFDIVPCQAPLTVEQCLAEAPLPGLYFLRVVNNAPGSPYNRRSLFGDYLYFKHWNIKQGDLFFTILNRPSDEQFKAIWKFVRQVSSFQEALYLMSSTHLQYDDARMKIIQDAVVELQGRIKRWADELHVRLNGHYRNTLAFIYSNIVHAVLKKAKDAADEQAKVLLLDIFRSAHRFHEQEQMCYSQGGQAGHQDKNCGDMLLQLTAMGVRADTPICSEDPEDSRTLLSAYLFTRAPSARVLNYAYQAWKTLSEEDALAERERWQRLPEFVSWFAKYKPVLEQQALANKEAERFVGFIMNSAVLRKSLFARLLT